MSKHALRVLTFGRGADWGFRIIDADGDTLATRRFFPNEDAARNSGHAAAATLAGISTNVPYFVTRRPAVTLQAPKRSFWKLPAWPSLLR